MDVRQFAFLARQPSAALQSRDSFWGLPKRGLAFILANAMFWQPLLVMADGIVVNGSGTTLGQAGNGVPVVNIAAPNGGGLSHNTFSDYNVGQQGVILNNATDRTQSTQLGGIILGNPNLGGRAANVILNEVNGGSPSQLKGYTEVAGRSAHVIVANPYGVTCNGCGFINTPKTTLTTGKPVIENGQLQRYQVDQGSVAIEGAGLNASNIDQFEIITRSAKVNAQIQARHLALVTGANDVDAQTLKATARAANPADAPQLAIDSSALGGMYAGAIKLVGTEAGVGVKLDGKLIASGGDIQLDANGQLRMVEATAEKGAVVIKAQGLETQGAVYAGTDLKVQTQGDLNNHSTLAAAHRVDLGSAGQLNNRGIIEAGVNLDNSRNPGGDVTLTAQTLNNSGKSVVASRDLTVTATQTLNNQGGTLSGQRQVKVSAGALDNQKQGRVLSADGLQLDADQVHNGQGGLIKSQRLLKANLGHLGNSGGELSSQGDGTLVLAGMDNLTGVVLAQQTLAITGSAELDNQGGLLSGWQGLSLNGTGLNNSNKGTVSSLKGSVDVTLSDALNNSQGGALVSHQTLDVKAASLDNSQQGVISSAGEQSLKLRDLLDNSQGGSIDSAATLTLQAMVLGNQGGTLNAAGDLVFTGSDLDNGHGSFTGKGAVTLDLLGRLINNQGTLSAAGPLLLKRSAAVENQGGELSSQQWLRLFAGRLDNRQKGRVAANDSVLVSTTGQVQNGDGGEILSRQAGLQIDAGRLDNTKGLLQAKSTLGLEVATDAGNQGGQVIAQQGDLTLKAASFDNNAGKVSALNGGATFETAADGRLDNRDGALFAQQALHIRAKDLDNSAGQISARQIELELAGALDNRQGLIESRSTLATAAASLDNQHGQLRALGLASTTRFSIGGTFDNRDGALETANNDLAFAAGGFDNRGGSLLHSGRGVFGISMANLEDVGGRLKTAGHLSLEAERWTNSSSIQADQLLVRVDHLTQTADGQLLAGNGLTGSGSHWSNDGLIGSDAALNLDLNGNYSGKGRLSSLGQLDLHAAQLDLADSASIAGGANSTLKIDGALNSAGRITASQKLLLNAASINNLGTLGSGEDLSLNATALVNDHGLISSGGNMQLLTTSFTNRYAQVYSLGNVLIAKDDRQARADLLDNRSGDIESLGRLTIAASTLNNVRDVLQYIEHEKSAASITRLSCALIPGAGCDDRGGGRINGLWEVAETDRLRVTDSSAAASLNSGADLQIDAQTLTNTSSLIAAAGDIDIKAQTLNNQGLQPQEITTLRRYWSFVNETGNAAARAAAFNARNNPTPSSSFASDLSAFIAWTGVMLSSSSKVVDGDQSFAATIQAGGKVNLKADQTLDNSVIRSFYEYVGAGKTLTDTGVGNGYSTAIRINPQLPPELAQQQVNPLELPGFTLPTGGNGLFRLSGQGSTLAQAPTPAQIAGLPDTASLSRPHKYLIETNPALTDLKQFMSSDYLLSNLGYNPDESAKRLGDGFYEQKLIRQAVTARTGQRFINGQDTDEKLFKYLMDNAVKSKQQLNLAVGVSLTSEQVAALTHDIVWLENAEVNGEQVLVPVLYLAQANNRLAPNGALIAGKDLNLIAGKDLNNVGTLRAANDLSAVAGQNLVNSGLMEAGNRQGLLAGNHLVNRAGGIIAGRDVTLTTTQGDVINDRTLTTHQSSSEAYIREQRRDFLDSAARIEAGNSLSIDAGRDLNNNGGVLKSGADTSLKAGRDVNLSAVEQVVGNDRGTRHNDLSVTQNGSSLQSGRDLAISAGRDLTAIASQIEAKRDVTMSATENLNLLSAANEQHSASKTKKVTSQEDHVQQVSTTLAAGGNVTLKAGEDLQLIASRVTAGNEAYLYAVGDVNLDAAQNSDYSYYRKTKTSSSGLSSTQKTRIDSSSSTTQEGSSVSGDKVVVRAGQDIGVTASNVVSTQSTSLVAGRNVAIDSATQTSEESHSTSKKKSGLLSSGGIGFTLGSSSLQNTSTRSSENAKVSTIGSVLGNVDIQAGKDLGIKGSDVVAGKDINLVGQNVSILAAENHNRSEQTSKSKTSGLTLALSGTVGSAIDTAYQTTKQAKEEDDSRLSALQGIKAGLTGIQAWQAAQQNGGMNADNVGQFVGISLSLGSQKSSSKQTQEQTVSQGSSLNAGGSLSILATGKESLGSDGDINVHGSKLQAAKDLKLVANRDINLDAAANTQRLDGKNSSSGGAVGASIGFGSSGAGLSIFANGNKGTGNEKGNGTTWTETTLDAGNHASLISGRDATLKGAQVNADKITANVGRDLTLQSLQDTDNYKSKQSNVSAGASFTIGTMTGSGSLSVSQSKIDSKYQSVQEQTGLFAGKGGYQIEVGKHTQLDGSVIASTAEADKNRLSTGTLGWSDLKNKADYTSQIQSASVSSGNGGTDGFISNMPSGTLIAYNHSGSASGTTSSAISNGTLEIRDPSLQKQDVTTLSHDVEHANGSISPIFDKEKEQKRLRQVQLIGEIGTQVTDIVRTEGQLKADKDASDELEKLGIHRPGKNASKEEVDNYQQKLIATDAYQRIMGKYGTGGDYQRVAQAVTAALQGLAGGDIGSALAGASAPYLAQLIKKTTGDNTALNAMAHAVLGAAVAQAQGNSAIAGAAGAAGGELAARLITQQLYGTSDTSSLSEEQKQTVAALSTLAAGLAGGIAKGDSAGAIAGAGAGKNAVENNLLANKYGVDKLNEASLVALHEKLVAAKIGGMNDLQDKFSACAGDGGCERAVRNEYRQREKESGENLVALYQAGGLNQEELNLLFGKYARIMMEGAKEGQLSSGWGGILGDIYTLNGNDWTPIGTISNPYLALVRSSEQIAEWKKQGLSDEKIRELSLKDGVISSVLAPVDVNGVTNLLNNGASKEELVRFAMIAAFGRAASGSSKLSKVTDGSSGSGGNVGPTLPKNFNESVLGHNTQIGVRNSKAGTISGAHNRDAFLESIELTGAKITNKITDARFPGLIEYSYQLPRTNTKRELIGGYKPVSTKTTYDPKVLPDDKVADMSSRAAIQADAIFKAKPNEREASIKIDGYYFQVTRNSRTGEITNSFITIPPRTK
ncbi:hemagglutinin repeat-containing protein [Pseudomonas sp. KCJK8993]|uniref:hemagglutinin repeat-containing protein n=1 Tax=Pseudomonas sp. KCJK8993 TaxID=3344565 RepID=UPI003905B9C1